MHTNVIFVDTNDNSYLICGACSTYANIRLHPLHYRILHMCIKINDLIFRLNTSCMRKKYSVTSITSRKFSIASLSDTYTDHLRVPGSDWSQDSSSETSASLSSSQSEPAWSWVVLLGSFICLCVLDGISYTFGMLLGKLLYCSFRNL